MARFRLSAHTLQIETVTWSRNAFPTCCLRNANARHVCATQDEQHVLFHCTHPNAVSLLRAYASLWTLGKINNKLHFFFHALIAFHKPLPTHLHTALQKWALVTQEKMASPLDFDPSYHHYWSADSLDALFGAHLDSLLSQFDGFSVCHPICNDHTMNLSLRHAIYSAILSTEATATFMFLVSWNASMITNPYSSLLTAYPHLCDKLGTIPAKEIAYTFPQTLVKRLPYPRPLEISIS